MRYEILILGIVVAALNWVAVGKGWKKVETITKPGVILLYLAWLWQNDSFGGQMLWFILGLFFSLAGDVLLLKIDKLFIPGLVAFLLAHVMYIIGFNLSITSISVPVLILALALFGGAQLLYRRLAQSLRLCQQGSLCLPVAFYTTIISLMAASALFTLSNPAWDPLHAAIAAVGALLFFLSDSLLAWNKFIYPISHANLIIMVTYHLGQLGILLASAWHFCL
jgi:alkenylglycerophosphocholine/alkenylglycerophosphoethanolamine hydrolase